MTSDRKHSQLPLKLKSYQKLFSIFEIKAVLVLACFADSKHVTALKRSKLVAGARRMV